MIYILLYLIKKREISKTKMFYSKRRCFSSSLFAVKSYDYYQSTGHTTAYFRSSAGSNTYFQQNGVQ